MMRQRMQMMEDRIESMRESMQQIMDHLDDVQP